MDLMGLVLLASLDRLAVVAACVAIGYWGYRLYAAEKQMGLVFLGLAVVILVGVLVTSASHVRSIGDSARLAQAQAPEPVTAPLPPRATRVAVLPGTPVDPDTSDGIVPPSIEPVNRVASVAPVANEPTTGRATTPAPADSEPDAPPASAPRLATVEELGGRVMSIRSEGVSIEWSTPTN